MSPSAFDPVVVEVRLPVPPAQVFAACTQSDELLRWLSPDITVEAVPGGPLDIALGPQTRIRGCFIEVAGPEKLAFSWGRVDDPEVPPESSRVDITLSSDEGSETLLRLVHRDLPLEYRQEHLDFWRHHLARLSDIFSESRRDAE